jgi:signal transduction histidine kinase
MDTELAPVIAEEVIRPPAAFRPTDVVAELPQFVLLQFESRPSGEWWSPQVPIASKASSARLQELRKATSYEHLLAELPSTPLPSAADLARNQAATNAESATSNISKQQEPAQPPPNDVATNSQQANNLADLEQNPYQFLEGNRANDAAEQTAQVAQPQTEQTVQRQRGAQNTVDRGSKEADFQQRSKRYQAAAQQGLLNYGQRGMPAAEQANAPPKKAPAPPPNVAAKDWEPPPTIIDTIEQVGVSRPMWIGERLLLARRVANRGVTTVQGSWLDWPQLKSRLLGEASDLLPTADLTAVNGNGAEDPSRMLAGLPVRLVVNESATPVTIGPTLHWALWLGWGAVLLAAVASAALLHGVMTLSERRAAFVSSVTHELRTPLTTFRMYAEMLARGMVPDAERRQEYFETLQKESERLTLLVENVLAYARLERGRKPEGHDRVTVVSLLQRVRPRLEQRAMQAGMECVVELNKKTASQEFTTDLAVVEQILFNLVDNAAKYARSASDLRIHVEANHKERFVTFVVRDHGPGIGAKAGRTEPFAKSAQESAESAPGVGLGLALCRRLARQMGGRLEISGANGEGTSVTLFLPTR